MRKSSLGRRSSTHIPVRVPSLGGSSGQRTCSGGKQKSGSLLKPGFSSQLKNRRSQSDDRVSCGGRPTLVWSNTVSSLPGRGLGATTPITPRQSLHTNLPLGSTRKSSRQSSTGSVRRESSFGGTKNARKDSRPISEKAFQQAAQVKVQQYFDQHATHVLGPGNKIRPMNTKLFVDMMDELLKKFDPHIFITKSNYLEEIPNLLRKFGYRSKIDRSWLMTVNTPHSWQHVVAVLSWLVDTLECMNSVDPFQMMFTNNMIDPHDEEDDDDDGVTVDKEIFIHLRKTYEIKDDPTLSEAHFAALDAEYFEKQIIDQKCTDKDFGILQREIDLVKEEVDREEDRRQQQSEILEKLQARYDALQNDIQINEGFIEEAKHFLSTSDLKLATRDQEIALKRNALLKKQEELQRLEEKVSCQQISVGEKEKLSKERQDLHRMIQFYENAIREYDNSIFAVDMKFADDQRKLEKLIVEYNKLVAEKYIVEPRLKDVEVKFTLLKKTDEDTMQVIDENLKSIKEEIKNSLYTLEIRKEEIENTSWRIKQEKKKTEEEISKARTLIEGVECDLEKQEELINKSEQNYKKEIKRIQNITKEITEEIAQFDEANLENKKEELKKIEHDWQLVQQRCQQRLEGEMAITQEIYLQTEGAVKKLIKKNQEFRQKHL